MELGQKLKYARLEAGLSQRDLCGEEITRNMLSLIENGSAQPSMGTLRYLAKRLNRPISFFLDDDAVTSPNLEVMTLAREAWMSGDFTRLARQLQEYHAPDPVFDMEKQLLDNLAALALARQALAEGRAVYARELLDSLGEITDGYCAAALERERVLLLARADPVRRTELLSSLPESNEELLLRAADALERADVSQAAALLGAAGEHESPAWNLLRGETYLASGQYARAAEHLHLAEEMYPARTAPELERCYRELEDYKQAYFYSCKQKRSE